MACRAALQTAVLNNTRHGEIVKTGSAHVAE